MSFIRYITSSEVALLLHRVKAGTVELSEEENKILLEEAANRLDSLLLEYQASLQQKENK